MMLKYHDTSSALSGYNTLYSAHHREVLICTRFNFRMYYVQMIAYDQSDVHLIRKIDEGKFSRVVTTQKQNNTVLLAQFHLPPLFGWCFPKKPRRIVTAVPFCWITWEWGFLYIARKIGGEGKHTGTEGFCRRTEVITQGGFRRCTSCSKLVVIFLVFCCYVRCLKRCGVCKLIYDAYWCTCCPLDDKQKICNGLPSIIQSLLTHHQVIPSLLSVIQVRNLKFLSCAGSWTGKNAPLSGVGLIAESSGRRRRYQAAASTSNDTHMHRWTVLCH